jgi:hypothetical protein
MYGFFKPQSTWIMDRYHPFGFLSLRQPCLCNELVDCFDRQFPAVFPENLVTVGTGDKDILNPITRQKILHLSEHGVEIVIFAEVMGRLCAAVKNDAERRNGFFHVFIKLNYLIGTRSGQSAAGKKYGVASVRQCIICITF